LRDARFWSRDELHDIDLTPLVAEVLRDLGWLDVTTAMSPQTRHAA
jgi:hypothetical protein